MTSPLPGGTQAAGDAPLDGVLQRYVDGVEGVDDAYAGGNGVGELVSVGSGLCFAIREDTDVGMGAIKPGILTRRVDDRASRRGPTSLIFASSPMRMVPLGIEPCETF